MLLKNIHILSFAISHLDIIWEYTEEVVGEVSNYLLYIYRSSGQAGTWELMTPTGFDITRLFFRDHRVNLLSKNREYFYKLKTVNTITGEEVEYDPAGLELLPDVISLDIVRRSNLLLDFVGMDVIVFQVKKQGVRCSCYDAKLGAKIRHNCESCFDITFTGGYNRGIKCKMNIVRGANDLTNTAMGDIENNMARGWTSNYPVISPRDLIVIPNNERYRVLTPVNYSTKLGFTTSQQFNLGQLDRSDIAFKVPISITAYPKYPAKTNMYEIYTDDEQRWNDMPL
jgi:hypothetical protein